MANPEHLGILDNATCHAEPFAGLKGELPEASQQFLHPDEFKRSDSHSLRSGQAFAEFTLSGNTGILRFAQNDSEGAQNDKAGRVERSLRESGQTS